MRGERGESTAGVVLLAVLALVAGGGLLVGATLKQNRDDDAALRAYTTRLDTHLADAAAGVPYAFIKVNANGDPVRWNPCEPIHYVVNLSQAPPGAMAVVEQAVAEVSAASGIPFAFDGETDELPTPNRPGYQPERYGRRWAPVLIAWLPLDSSGLTTNAVGVADPYAVGVREGNVMIVSAQIGLDSLSPRAVGFDTKDAWGGVLMHELGHVLGLHHVTDPDQLMHGSGRRGGGPAEWGEGDRTGLRRVGAEAGCLRTPRAG